MQPDGINLSFANNRLAMRRLRNIARSLVKTEKDARLLEDQRLRRVHILAGVLLLY